MSDQPIRVGFIGLNPASQWAASAHIPALKALGSAYEVVGVANTSLESAERAAQAFGLKHAFADAQALMESDDVDLVVITVRVPYHYDLLKAALGQGKHIYCEWPLARSSAQAREIADLAEEKGVVGVVGTQFRVAPEIAHLRQLIADGYVGEVLSTTLIGSGGSWGAQVPDYNAYLHEKANGATLLTIPLMHTLAGLQDVLGEVAEVEARTTLRRPQVAVTGGEPKSITSDVPDQILVHGSLQGGAPIAVHYRGGMSRGTNLHWEINGTQGDIIVSGPVGHAQMAPLTISGARGGDRMGPLMPPPSAYEGWPEDVRARNVAIIYDRLARDIRTGTRTAPTFRSAIGLHELIERIEASAART